MHTAVDMVGGEGSCTLLWTWWVGREHAHCCGHGGWGGSMHTAVDMAGHGGWGGSMHTAVDMVSGEGACTLLWTWQAMVGGEGAWTMLWTWWVGREHAHCCGHCG